jgi:F420H(2)-dependent quinone reductase
VSGKSRGARLVGRTLRTPSVLDRKGTRWILQALSPAPIIVLIHRGRKSGRVYKTPVEMMVDDPERGELVVAPMWGRDSDWYRQAVLRELPMLGLRPAPSR